MSVFLSPSSLVRIGLWWVLTSIKTASAGSELELSQQGKFPEKNFARPSSFNSQRTPVISVAEIYIVTVPTPIGKYLRPSLTPLVIASETVGRALNAGEIVLYESIVYPGCTEEDCKRYAKHP